MASSSPSGVELKDSETMSGAGAGVALSFPANDSPSPSSTSKLPRRLRRRLSESRCPSTAEEIEAKLKEADLRRQVLILSRLFFQSILLDFGGEMLRLYFGDVE